MVKKKIVNPAFFLLLVLFNVFEIKSQTDPYIDSLKKLLQKRNLPDTSIVKLKSDIGMEEGIMRLGYWDSLSKQCNQFFLKAGSEESKRKLQFTGAGALNNLGYVYNMLGEKEKAIEKYKESLSFYEKIDFGKDTALRKSLLIERAQTINNIATATDDLGDTKSGKELHLRSLSLRMEADDKEGIALSYNNLAYIANSEGDVKQALEYYFQSLKIREQIEDWKGLGQVYGNIATMYSKHYGTDKAIEYHRKSLVYWIKANEKSGIAHALNNIGTCYLDLGNLDSAYLNYEKALKIRTEINYKKGIGNSYYNIARVYAMQNKLDEAEAFYFKSLGILKEVKDKLAIAQVYQTLAEIYILKNKLTEALNNAELSLKMAEEIPAVEAMQKSAKLLYIIYSKMKQPAQALKMYELHIQLRDSISNVNNKRQAISKQFEYQYERKAAQDSLENAIKIKEEQLKHEQEISLQRTYTYGGLIGFVLMLVVAVISFKAYKNKQKANSIITEQKKIAETQRHIIEEKQKEIIESITYAKRLQEAILPPKDFLNRYLPSNFILYKPKDLVAGDFYWAEHIGDLFFIAAADSTGHGVPGAMVSVVCSNALNRTVKEFELTDTGKILDKTRDLVLETFAKSASEVKDGMDISLLCVDLKNKRVFWSGANNPLWYVLNSSQEPEFKEIKADKQPIGKTDHPKPFTVHTIDYKEGSMFYLITDGYADQFGGPNGKKFKHKQLSELLLRNSALDLNTQYEMLNSAFLTWKGDLEQVDDVTILGIRI